MKTTAAHIVTLIAIALVCGCNQVPVVETATAKNDSLGEHLINANRYIAGSEAKQIDGYVERRGWTPTTLIGGTRVWETVAGSGRIEPDDTVVVDYRLEAIDGRVFYSHATDTVVAGRMQPTRGLDAALLTLSHGSEATVIVPSEQGYGVMGDGDRVGRRMILVYKVSVK